MAMDFIYNVAQTLVVWCRAGLRGDFLSSYTGLFYEPQTLVTH